LIIYRMRLLLPKKPITIAAAAEPVDRGYGRSAGVIEPIAVISEPVQRMRKK
jgi:hypothetical protein